MELNEYKTGDLVLIKMTNPQTNQEEWKDAEVLDKRMIYPEKSNPYPILIVRTKRTYCKATPIYRFIGNIPIYVDSNLEFYDKENDEGIIYKTDIRLK